MSSRAWRDRPISELCTKIIDCVNKTAPVVEGPTPYRMIRTTNVKRGLLDLTSVRYVEKETYDKWTRRGAPRAGDIVLTREAPLGEVALVHDDAGIFLGQRLMMYRVDQEQADSSFLMNAMRAPDVQAQIKAFGSGSTVEHMRVPDCGHLLVACPDVVQQRRIGAIFRTLDELIAVNERRIELLKGQARSLYREWFARQRLPGHEAARWSSPGDGPPPSEWRLLPLFQLADVTFGFPFKSSGFDASGPYPVIRIRDVPRGATSTFTVEESAERYAVRDGDVLIGMDGEFHMAQWTGGPAWLNQRVARLRPRRGVSARLLMLAMSAPLRHLNDSIVGTTVAHLGKRHLEEIRFLLPSDDALAEATASFDALAEQELVLVKQSRQLAATRDLLLPRLVTGRLDISDVELGDLLDEEAA